MKTTLSLIFVMVLGFYFFFPQINQLTKKERKQGWQLLFDGKSLKNWHSAESETPSKNWSIEKQCLKFTPSEPVYDKDIITKEIFGNFELKLDWKISQGGNSGIFFRIDKNLKKPIYESGLEMQILDNLHHPNGKYPQTSAGACYGLYSPTKEVVKTAGSWNQAHIKAIGSKIEFFLNKEKIIEFDTNSQDFQKRIANSKFRNWKNFGKLTQGYIALQDHNDEVWFRNVKIRRISD